MSKRSLSPSTLPGAKRVHGLKPQTHSVVSASPFNDLYDEIALVIFSYLSYSDLCAIQSVNRNCSRLALDNQVLHNTRRHP